MFANSRLTSITNKMAAECENFKRRKKLFYWLNSGKWFDVVGRKQKKIIGKSNLYQSNSCVNQTKQHGMCAPIYHIDF